MSVRLSILIILLALAAAMRAFPTIMLINQQNVMAQAGLDEVWNIYVCTNVAATNWAFATNIIGDGGSNPPSWIDVVKTNGNKFYKMSPE